MNSANRHLIFSHRGVWDIVRPALDSAAIISSLVGVHWLSGGGNEAAWIAGMVAVVIFLLASHLTGLHRRVGTGSADTEMTDLVVTWSITIVSLAVIVFVGKLSDNFARSDALAWVVIAPSLIGLSRMCVRILQRGMHRRGIGVRRVAVVGLNQLGRQLADTIQADPSMGLNFIGYFDDRGRVRDEASAAAESPIAAIGKLADLVCAARDGQIDTVLITLPMRAEDRIRGLLDRLSDTTASVYIVPDFFVFELLHSRWTNVGGLPAVSVFENPLFGVDGAAKRLTDLVIATAALLIAAVPMLLIAIAVKASSAGPVFFRQRRYGLDGREILVWKFRSMRTCDDGPVVRQATRNDPRITPLGAILRKTSLDELPQLFNVIDGSMSLVGPRPHASAHNEQFRSLIRGYMLRHKVKPGITGLAQVNGCRGETETIDKMQARVALDHQYIRTWSLWLDLSILVKTFWVVWRQPEAR